MRSNSAERVYTMAKLRVAVLFGGVSGEHEISCISAASVVENMDADRYEIFKVGITKKGRWLLYPGATTGMRDGSWETFADCVPAFISPDATTRGLVVNHNANFDVIKLDVCFPVLHGPQGEDGSVQGLLELAGIPYVGCGVLSSAVCMDKAAANLVFDANNIPHTPWMAITRHELRDFDGLLFRLQERIKFPVFVKPASGGSSLGVSKVKQAELLRSAIQLAMAHDDKVVLEQAVDGQEVECAVLGNQEPIVTLPGEIESCNEVYDYEAKYQSGDASRLFWPAQLPQQKLEEVQEMAKRTYAVLGCEGLARVDFFVERGSGRVFVNEVNTMPGFTTISMYPKMIEHTGVAFPRLVDRLIELAQERVER